MNEINKLNELIEIKKRYERRNSLTPHRYNILQPDVYLRKQEFERGLIKWLTWKNYPSIQELKLLEIGCGGGLNLLKFIELGFQPVNILGNELLTERAVSARKILPKEIEIIEGDALKLDISHNSYDVVFQSTVFSSILNFEFQKELAEKLWNIAKPEGGILWYDFTYNNPRNRDVSGITLKKIRQLFPNGIITHWRMTLAPPISRFVTKFHPNLYSLFNIFPFLKTHILCWIEKK